MNRRVSSVTRITNGRLALLLIGGVTAADLILRAFGARLTFPCAVWFPLWLIDRAVAPAAGYALGGLLSAVILLAFLYVTVGEKRNEHHPVPFRFAWLLYAADTLFYFAISVSSITSDGFSASHIIELAFHVFCTVLLYLADRAASGKPGPAENGTQRQTESRRPESDETGNDGQDDEGIQW
ncbi:MAG: hypothetical protein ILO68_02985 [Clostridia bacterium]|nr:hypothetical protein [Clostridia bacterium]